MNRIKSFTWLLTVVIVLASCKKSEFQTAPLAALKIVNAVTGGESVKMGSVATTVAVNNNANFMLIAGTPDIYVWPISDTTKPYFNAAKSITVADREYYTLFLGGTVANPLGVMVKENYSTYQDSIAGIRFINLSANSSPVNVTLSTSTTVHQFAGVAYGNITDFKTYPAGPANSTYTFQVRNALTNAIIASATMSGTSVNTFVPVFKNTTLVLRGTIGATGTNAPSIVRVNHY
ncbi:MAG: hypothetical protein ACN4EP_13770 [Sediminibacterium sp.]